MPNLEQQALKYHRYPHPGKLKVVPSKPVRTQAELSLAYTPGVAYPCLKIQADPESVYEYTNRTNSVAVISDGSAVLGLGNIGPRASLPVMEGKAVLLKKFAGIDGIPLVIKGKHSPTEFARIVAALSESFGAINLEDIKAPQCFTIETEAQKRSTIPVFHDDQHGAAIIALAAIITSLKLVGKKLTAIKVVISGAGAAGIACAQHFVAGEIKPEQLTLVDSKGVIHAGRKTGMNPYKRKYAAVTSARTLGASLKGADVFVGVSTAGILRPEMVKQMNRAPIILAMANPEPEILPEEALRAGAAVVATGRSDYRNQVNNLLGFPGIFRAALDVRAPRISRRMKLAATAALVELAEEPLPPDIQAEFANIYPADAKARIFARNNPLSPELILPKPFDRRIVPRVARRVAETASKEGLARKPLTNPLIYETKVANFIRENNG